MSGIADTSPDAGQPGLKSGPQRIGKDDGDIEATAQFTSDSKDRVARFDGFDRIDFRHGAPKIGQLFLGQNSEMGVEPAGLDRTDGGDAHDGVAQPVA